MDIEHECDKPTFLLEMLQRDQQISCEKILDIVNENVHKDLLKDDKKGSSRIGFSRVEEPPKWMEMYDYRCKKDSGRLQGHEQSLEMEKESLLNELHKLTKDLMEAKKEESKLGDLLMKTESQVRSSERILTRVTEQFNDYFTSLESIHRALKSLQETEGPRLQAEIRALRKAHKSLEADQERDYQALVLEMEGLLLQEAVNIQETLVKEIQILDMEQEIEFFSNQTKDLQSKKQIAEEEDVRLMKADQEKASDLQSVAEFVWRIAKECKNHN